MQGKNFQLTAYFDCTLESKNEKNLRETSDKCYDVPLIESIQCLLKSPVVLNYVSVQLRIDRYCIHFIYPYWILNPHPNDQCRADFCDGSSCKSNALFQAHPNGCITLHCNSARLLVEVYTCSKVSDQFVSTGVRRVEAGLSFPTRGPPIWYNLALETARANRHGVFQYGADMGVDELMPCVLKDSLADQGGRSILSVVGSWYALSITAISSSMRHT